MVDRLYPELYPYPPSCQATILNTQCAYDMARLCSTVTSQNIAALNDAATSNCRVWKDSIETFYDIDPLKYQNLQTQLDNAIISYCKGVGINSDECSCLNFPSTLSNQCSAQGSVARGCDATNILDCPGKQFTRVAGGFPVTEKNGTIVNTYQYIIVSFNECIPYYCWNDLCWQNNSLLPSWIRGNQQTCSSGICLNVQGVDQITITDLTPPPSAESFQPRQVLMGSCGRGHQPATPTFIPTQWNSPINNTFYLPLAITNNGDDILNLVYQQTTNNSFLATVPPYITIGPHGSYNFNVYFNNTLLTDLFTNLSPNNEFNVTVTKFDGKTPAYTIQSPEFFYNFNSGGTTQTFSFTLEMILRPPVNNEVQAEPTVIVKRVPLGFQIAAVASAVLVLISIIFLIITQTEAINALKLI